MFRVILIFFLFYGVFWFFTRFLLPLVKIVRMTQKGVNEMKRNQGRTEKKQKKTEPIEGEYIDFEEVD